MRRSAAGFARRTAAALGIAGTASLAACSATGPDDEPRASIGDLDTARALWASRGPSHYDVDFRWVCFCGPEATAWVTLSVADDVLAGVVDRESGAPLSASEAERYRSITGLFEFLVEARAEGAAAVQATFDAELGTPLSAYVDYSEQAVDEEMGFTLEGLRAAR